LHPKTAVDEADTSFQVDKKIVMVSFSFVGNDKNRTILIWQYHVGPSANLNGMNQFRGGNGIAVPSCCFVNANTTRIRVVLSGEVKRMPCWAPDCQKSLIRLLVSEC